MSGVPVITFTLATPAGTLNIAPYVTMEVSPEVSNRIEAPGETNVFTAPDIQVKCRDDAALTVTNLFSAIGPTSTNYRLTIVRDGVTLFTGMVLPTSVTTNPIERTVAFTAVGNGEALARTDAGALSQFIRTFADWFVITTSETFDYVIVAAGGSPQTSDFFAGDTVRFFVGKEYIDALLAGVEPQGSPPYTSWKLIFAEALDQPIREGTLVNVSPSSRYRRNVPLRELVDGLYTGSGLPATLPADYNVTPVASDDVFATAPNLTDLNGTPLSVTSYPRAAGAIDPLLQTRAVVGSTTGAYSQASSPGGAWTLEVAGSRQPVDWRPIGSGKYLLYGPRRVYEKPDYLTDIVTVYAYNYIPDTLAAAGGTFKRFKLSLTSIRKPLDGEGRFDVTLLVEQETSTDAVNWGSAAPVYVPATFSTLGDPMKWARDSMGIEVDWFANLCYFTDVSASSPGAYPDFNISRFSIATLVVTPGLIPGVRGFIFSPDRALLHIFALDTFRNNAPTCRVFNTALGGPTLTAEVGVPKDFVPWSLKSNPGVTNRYYALASSAELGTRLLQFTNSSLDFDTNTAPTQLLPPGAPAAALADLAVIKDPARPAGGGVPWPMVALFGTQVWWVDFAFSSIVSYADLEGLSCGDALAQLASLVNAFYYVDALGRTYFRTRSLSSARPIGVSQVLDDSGALTVTGAPVWQKSYLYVRVVNEKDQDVFGEEGNPAFRGKDQGLEIQNRFVNSISFADALAKAAYAYFSTRYDAADVEHEVDGRDYTLGNIFTANVNGSVKTFQIIETSEPVFGPTLRVQGIKQ